MEDPTESAADDWEIPEPPTELEELRDEVRSLQIYVKTLSQSYAGIWRQVIDLRKKLQDLGVDVG